MEKPPSNNKLRKGLHVIILGGTIDFDIRAAGLISLKVVDKLTPRETSAIPFFLSQRVKYPPNEIVFTRVALKDSRDLTKGDMTRLAEEIEHSPFKRILVTMGIVGIHKTRDYLKKHLKNSDDKIIGIVGSYLPLSAYQSDGGFHMGFAIAWMQHKKPGIYSFHPDDNRRKIKEVFRDTVIIMTGGTIDSGFNEQHDTARPYEHSMIPSYFKNSLGISFPEPELIFNEVCMKDSRDLSEEDIHSLFEKSKNLSHKRQIITIGTYALPDISNRIKYLMQKGEMKKNTVILVGAMVPEDVLFNDGWFNLGYSIGKIDSVKREVAVCMHGWASPPENVMKQLHEARFRLYNPDLKL